MPRTRNCSVVASRSPWRRSPRCRRLRPRSWGSRRGRTKAVRGRVAWACQLFVHRFTVVGVGCGDVVAAHPQQQLAFLSRRRPGGRRFPRFVRTPARSPAPRGIYPAAPLPSRSAPAPPGAHAATCGELLGVVDFEVVGIQIRLNACRRGSLGLWVCFAFIAADERSRWEHASSQHQNPEKPSHAHWITSRPTAMFNWAAAVRYEPSRFT